jgi:hypothetical protein
MIEEYLEFGLLTGEWEMADSQSLQDELKDEKEMNS